MEESKLLQIFSKLSKDSESILGVVTALNYAIGKMAPDIPPKDFVDQVISIGNEDLNSCALDVMSSFNELCKVIPQAYELADTAAHLSPYLVYMGEVHELPIEEARAGVLRINKIVRDVLLAIGVEYTEDKECFSVNED